jgi:hypothetical protein
MIELSKVILLTESRFETRRRCGFFINPVRYRKIISLIDREVSSQAWTVGHLYDNFIATSTARPINAIAV